MKALAEALVDKERGMKEIRQEVAREIAALANDRIMNYRGFFSRPYSGDWDDKELMDTVERIIYIITTATKEK